MRRLASEHIADHEIIAGLKAGGTVRMKTETQLYLQFNYMINAGSRKHHISEENAASAYSNTIIAVIKNITGGVYENRGSLESYVHRIFHHKCVDEQRSNWTYFINQSKEDAVELLINKMPDKTGSIINALIKKQEWAILSEKIKALGEKCHDILMLWGNHYPDQEIADIMQYSSAKVARVTRSRCLEKIQQEMSANKFSS